MNGLNKPELRTKEATATLTAAEYNWLKTNPQEVIKYSKEIQREYANIQRHEIASTRAKKAVITKRKKYKLWPANRK